MTISEYIDRINTRYKTGISTEHSYRADLQNLVESLSNDVMVTNEPTRVACGAPDYIITRKNIPVGYIEAKDIGKSLDSKDYKDQFDRYRNALNNLIITDYLEFRLYRDGTYVLSVVIGAIQGNKIVAKNENFEAFIGLIKDFCIHVSQTIKSASKLSKMMAGKAKLLATIIEKALVPDDSASILYEPQNLNLHNQYEAFKQYLIHDITEKAFADIYAQTIAYGMFAARLHDPSLDTFTRQEAAELIPKSNPFLRNLFQYVAGYELDDRIKWIVDALADIFRATNVSEVLKDFGKSTQQHDPMIHFYETFLAEYDPALRKKRGVYYTPEPVVNFIVRAVDDILKNEFGISQGLADTSKVKVKIKDVTKATSDLRSKVKDIERDEEVHRVQILDPAAGTGTFLAEVIKQIYSKFVGQQGIWSNYVEGHLIPRLNGFEILMASYAMAHLKLDLLLSETVYSPKKEQRLKVYLTNSLEEYHPDTGTLFASWLSTEANEANRVKRDTPVMVILGNPPYSVSSTNKSKWIEVLTTDYKHNLNERNIQPLSDDYIKFIRFGQYFINKNGEGILAYISNNSFIDGIIHRQMRRFLLEDFNIVYILDLHGNKKKKEICPDGSFDQNVFDIMQGVSINIFVKSRNNYNKKFAKVFHFDLYGKRQEKYDFLYLNSMKYILWKELHPKEPYFFLINKDYKGEGVFKNGIKIDELFNLSASGIKTQRDDASISFRKEDCTLIYEDFINLDDYSLREKYGFKDVRDWKVIYAKEDLRRNPLLADKILYRPFDIRYMIYTGKTKGVMGYPRFEVMQHALKDNLIFLTCRQQSSFNFQHVLISKNIIDMCTVSLQTKETTYAFPLYLYSEEISQRTINQTIRRVPNFSPKIVNQIVQKLSLNFTDEKELTNSTFAPIDILDYIYAVLHSPSYREKYKEFLKIDFPRVPYPKDKDTFWQLVKLGSELRQIHLLESPTVNNFITTYPVNGSNEVGKVRYADEKVWINNDQYFDNVPQIAWEFYIGGYQPAQKWLKDRKGRVLSFDDIMHYQRIIVALSETARIMKEIDLIDFLD